MKTSELTGAALDWAVAKCEGVENTWGKSSYIPYDFFLGHRYSTSWSEGGPIIEREGIDLYCTMPKCVSETHEQDTGWDTHWRAAYHRCGIGSVRLDGTTPLIAAMRCYCRAVLGDEIEIPEELK